MKLKELNESNNFLIAYDGIEYRVPGPDGREETAYYTDDKEDALGIAAREYGEDILNNIKFKRVSSDWMLAQQSKIN